MNPVYQEEIVTKECPCGCGVLFSAPRWHNKRYATVRCQLKMKRQRMKERAHAVTATSMEVMNRRPDADYVANPTVEVIVGMSKTTPLTRPVIFYGVVPEVPANMLATGCVFEKQEDGTWLML